jgi:hypothetical protein
MNEDKILLDSLRRVIEQLHRSWIEKEACAGLAISKGATVAEVKLAKQAALDDPVIHEHARDLFAGMWAAMETAALALLHAEELAKLPRTDKPN